LAILALADALAHVNDPPSPGPDPPTLPVQEEGIEDYVKLTRLRALCESGDIALIKASHLLYLAMEDLPLPRRQDLPEDAFLDKEELGWLFEDLEAIQKFGMLYEMCFPPLVVVSYAWETPEHPDPECRLLKQVLACAIEWYTRERAGLINAGGVRSQMLGRDQFFPFWVKRVHRDEGMAAADFAVFLDYSSMCQKPRTAEADASFGRALHSMDLLYGHQLTVKWRLTQPLTEHVEGRKTYNERGWPYFETCAAELISTNWHCLDLGQVDWSQPIPVTTRKFQRDKMSESYGMMVGQKSETNSMTLFTGAACRKVGGMESSNQLAELAKGRTYEAHNAGLGVIGLLKNGRTLPTLPVVFARNVMEKSFTNGADIEAVIAMYERVAGQVLAGVEVLELGQMWLKPDDMPQLVQVMAACPRLKGLDMGLTDLSEHIGILGKEMAKIPGKFSTVSFGRPPPCPLPCALCQSHLRRYLSACISSSRSASSQCFKRRH
jgi:hypothetical protein